MIKETLATQRKNPKVLVENKISFAGPDTELSIYDTFEQAQRVQLASDQLLFCGMVSGKKVMHDDYASYESEFLPHESFVMAPNHHVEIDFPDAQIDQPTTCLAIEISLERIGKIVNHIEQQAPLDKSYGQWQYHHHLVHTHHNAQTQDLLNRIVQIYTENHQDRNYMIDLAISELTIRLLRHQTRDLIIAYSEQTPDHNGLNAAVNYINQNLAANLNIDELCKLACMSRTKFFQQFRVHLGCTPGVYQQQTRLKKAAMMIKQGQQITRVCFELGYNNPSHFSRCFKQFFNLSPSTFKRHHLSS
ncbi:MAG: AraC family transcriptional regulator [Colwellia sp. Phe_37]|nr:MAG: AraC family transcriptional regulator [Colwellia sp. Phe_37]